MPTYVYKCAECDIEVEEMRKMSQADDPLDCPLCDRLLVRGITSFMFNRGGSAPPTAKPSQQATKQHGRGCPCCFPTPRRKKNGIKKRK